MRFATANRRAAVLAGLVLVLAVAALGLLATGAEARVECGCHGTIMVCDIYNEEGYLTGFVIWENHPRCGGGGGSSR